MEEAQSTTEFRLLGPFEVLRGGAPVALGGLKQRSLLAVLLLSANEVVSRDRLVEELWAQDTPKDAAHTVQVFVSRLRKALGREVIETKAPGYVVGAAADQLDLFQFETLRRRGREALAAGRPAEAEDLLANALALFRGPALADFAYEAWAQAEVARLEEERLLCLEDRLEGQLALGKHGEVLGELEQLCTEHPLREHLRGQRMLALYRQGRQAEALESYQQTRRLLDDQLGIEPSADLNELHRRILNHNPVLVVTPARAARAKLPAQPTVFLGRERELREVLALLRDDDVRLVTLTGPGGAGKTRLALEAAKRATDDFGAAVYWVPLQDLRDADLLEPAIATALQASGEIAEAVGGQRIVIVLDNFEQLIAGAARVASLLAACPALKILVTSREALRIEAERQYEVPALEDSEAVTFFLARAHAIEPHLAGGAKVEELCRRLDNLPLALELAAGRASLLDPEQMLTRLDSRLPLLTAGRRDAAVRHQTLHTTIRWSYELLDIGEQALFSRLAVFSDGFTLDAAEGVCKADLELLQALVDKSLIRSSITPLGRRYSMLQTIKEFAAELLEIDADADELRDRHSEFFGRLVTNADSALMGPDQRRWLATLDAEASNCRVALQRELDRGEIHRAAEIASVLATYWWFRGQAAERLPLLEAVLQPGLTDDALRASVLIGRGNLAFALDDRDREQASFVEALRLSTACDDLDGVALAQANLTWCAERRGDSHSAARHARLALDAVRSTSPSWLRAFVLCAVAAAATLNGDDMEANRLSSDALAIAQDPRSRWMALTNLGWFHILAEDYDAARPLLSEALAIRDPGDSEAIAIGLSNLGLIELFTGRRTLAASHFAESVAVCPHGNRVVLAEAALGIAGAAALASRPEPAVTLWAASTALHEQSAAPFTEPLKRIETELLEPLRSTTEPLVFTDAWRRGRTLGPNVREFAIAQAHALDGVRSRSRQGSRARVAF